MGGLEFCGSWLGFGGLNEFVESNCSGWLDAINARAFETVGPGATVPGPVFAPVPEPVEVPPELGGGFGDGELEPLPLPPPLPLLPELEVLPLPVDGVPPELPRPLLAMVPEFPEEGSGKGLGTRFGKSVGGRTTGCGVSPDKVEAPTLLPPKALEAVFVGLAKGTKSGEDDGLKLGGRLKEFPEVPSDLSILAPELGWEKKPGRLRAIFPDETLE